MILSKIKNVLLFCLTAVSAVAPAAADGWSITVNDPAAEGYSGAAVANGVLSVVSSPELFTCSESILAGTFDRSHSGDCIRLLSGYNALNGRMWIGDKELSRANVSDFCQILDMRNSTFRCTFSCPEADVKYEYIPLGGHPHAAMLLVNVMPKTDTTLRFENVRNTPGGFVAGPEYVDNSVFPGRDVISASCRSAMGRVELGVASGIIFRDADVKVRGNCSDNGTQTLDFSTPIERGKTFTFALLMAEFNSLENSTPQVSAERQVFDVMKIGVDRLMEAHGKYWADLWRGDIEIEGNERDQQDVRRMIYSIYSSVRPGLPTSPSPYGLSSVGFSGHVFWDTEIWMYPPMLVLNPAIARAMLDYRYERMEAARRNAVTSGDKGLRFPWESADDGDEQTPSWADTGYQEIHITADVAIAAWNYYLVTHDMDWLREKGAPLIFDGADFWLSRAVKEDDGKYHIRNVVGADEFACNIDDNAFTNGSAKKHLQIAGLAAKALGRKADPRWQEVADGLAFHSKDGVTQVYRGYDGQMTKQADVVLLAYPLELITDPAQIRRDLNYYKDKVHPTAGPAMTEGVYSVLYSGLGDAKAAEENFYEAFRRNQHGPFRGIAECKGGTMPYFCTGAGGALQAVLMGFAGYEITPKGLVKHPVRQLPVSWKSLKVKVAN